MRLGILTGGGDCPGLNAVIRAVVKKAVRGGDTVLGIRNGWAGLIRPETELLTETMVSGILPKGGTILGTSRTNPLRDPDLVSRCFANFRQFELDGLIAVGGEDTLNVAWRFSQQGMPIVGIPKTIDNDLPGSDVCIGFDTAVNTVVEAIDRLHSTAESHHRVMVVEVMGRHSGWIAAWAGLAAGADRVVVPEETCDIEAICATIRRRRERGKDFSIIVVAEGAVLSEAAGPVTRDDEKTDEFGHKRLGGVGDVLAREIEKRTGIETRVTILGHIQRGGAPSGLDRVLGSRLGMRAVDLARQKRFGRIVTVLCGQISEVPLEMVSRGRRNLTPDFLQDLHVLEG